MRDATAVPPPPMVQRKPETATALLRELVSILRESRTELREEWARRITESRLLTAMTREEIFEPTKAQAAPANAAAIGTSGS